MKIKRKWKQATAFALAILLCLSILFDSGAMGVKASAGPEKHMVTVERCDNGSVALTKQDRHFYAEGDLVRIRVEPDQGYRLGTLAIVDGEENDIVPKRTADRAEFSMPGADVTVTAEFLEAGEKLSAGNEKGEKEAPEGRVSVSDGKEEASKSGHAVDEETASLKNDGNVPDKDGGVSFSEEENGTDGTGAQTPGTDKAGAQTPGTDKAGAQTAETDKTGAQTPGTDKAGAQTPETDKTGAQAPGTDKAGAQTPETDKTGTQTPEADETGVQMPGTDKTGAQTPETDKAGAQTSEMDKTGAQTPETDKTSAQTPGTDGTKTWTTEEEVQRTVANNMDILEALEQGETVSLRMFSARASGEEVELQITTKDFYGYSEYGLGTWGTRRWEVVFEDPDTGEEKTVYAYCIQPKKNRPGDCTAKLVKLSDNKLISRVIWAGNSTYSGENSFWNCARQNGWMTGGHWDCAREYGWADKPGSGAEWIITHIAASKVNGDKDWDYGANSSAREIALELIEFASREDSAIDYPEISFSETEVTAQRAAPGDWKTGDDEPRILKAVKACGDLIHSGVYQKTPAIRVSGSLNNTVTFTAPQNVYCFGVTGGRYGDTEDFEVLADGRIKYTVAANTKICFIAPLSQTEDVSANFRVAAQGTVRKTFTPYKLTISGPEDYQDLAMIMGTAVPGSEREAAVMVHWVTAGDLHIEKEDSCDGEKLAGAVFHLLDGEGNVVVPTKQNGIQGDISEDGRITVGKDGRAHVENIPAGGYSLREIQAPAGYRVSQEGITVQILPGGEASLTVGNGQIAAGIRIQKYDAETGRPDPQGGAAFENGRFRIVALQACKIGPARHNAGDVVYDSLTLDRDGRAETPVDALAKGRYRLEETGAPTGYLVGGSVEFAITEEDHGKIKDIIDGQVADPPIRGGVKIKKVDRDAKGTVPQGGAALEGAVFELVNRNAKVVLVEGREYADGQVVHTMKIGANGTARTDPRLLPYGKYAVREAVGGQPKGYLWNEDNYREFSITQEGVIVDLCGDPMEDPVIRGDLSIRKINSDTQRAMAGVAFRITSMTTGESHTCMTDANGYYSTSSSYTPHTRNTNGGKLRDGIWFGLGAAGERVEIDDALGALPYDTYRIEELPGENNEGMNMFSDNFVISEDGVTIELGNIENKEIAIGTTAKDGLTGTHCQAAEANACIVDTVFFQNLDKNVSYTIKGILMDRSTKEPVRDADGNSISSEKTFRPAAGTGSVDVEFVFDASGFSGMAVVVFEELFESGEKLAEHKDIEDEGQTIYYPGIATRAVDSKTSTNVSCAEKEVTLVDTVSYTGLQTGRPYRLTGTLMVKETGAAYVDADGRTVTASRVFVPETPSGTVEVPFTFNGLNAAGKTLVVFEELLRGGQTYAVHADLADENQTVYFPGIETMACAEGTGEQIAMAAAPLAVTDMVSYSNLKPGQEYRLAGALMVKETGKVLEENGVPVTAETLFVPEAPSGAVKMRFVFNAENLAGNSVVLFEELYIGRALAAYHKDIEDDGQTVHIPKIRTTALDGDTKTHKAKASGEMKLVDTVTYKNLIPGKTYTITGTLMDAATGNAVRIDGKEVISEEQFEPKEADGSIDMAFHFNGISLAGKTVVVFESLVYKGVEIAAHKDIRDKGQSVAILSDQSVKGASVEKQKTDRKIYKSHGVSGKSVGAVKTGDTSDICIWGTVGLASLGILAILLMMRRKNRKSLKGGQGS